jgi:hypothetical protein
VWRDIGRVYGQFETVAKGHDLTGSGKLYKGRSGKLFKGRSGKLFKGRSGKLFKGRSGKLFKGRSGKLFKGRSGKLFKGRKKCQGTTLVVPIRSAESVGLQPLREVFPVARHSRRLFLEKSRRTIENENRCETSQIGACAPAPSNWAGARS